MNAILLVLTGLMSFTIFLMLHFALWQRQSANHSMATLVKLTLLSAIVVGLAVYFGAGFSAVDLLWVSLPIHLFLSLLYFHWYVAMYRSLSIRIMGELILAGGTMSLADLDRVYPLDEMYRLRLKLLEEEGWIEARDGYFVSTPKGRMFGSAIRAMRKLYGFHKAG